MLMLTIRFTYVQYLKHSNHNFDFYHIKLTLKYKAKDIRHKYPGHDPWMTLNYHSFYYDPAIDTGLPHHFMIKI